MSIWKLTFVAIYTFNKIVYVYIIYIFLFFYIIYHFFLGTGNLSLKLDQELSIDLWENFVAGNSSSRAAAEHSYKAIAEQQQSIAIKQ